MCVSEEKAESLLVERERGGGGGRERERGCVCE